MFMSWNLYFANWKRTETMSLLIKISTCTSESTNGRHLLIGRILENNADEKGEPQYEEK